jgi:hypothetical protein
MKAGDQIHASVFYALHSSVSIVTVYGLDDRGSILGGAGKFLFDTASRMPLRPTHPPIQWVPGALSLGGKAAEA